MMRLHSSLVSASHGWPLGLSLGPEVSVEGILRAVAIGVDAAGRVVLTDLCTCLRRRLQFPPDVLGRASVWRPDERVGPVWRHKQICNHRNLLEPIKIN